MTPLNFSQFINGIKMLIHGSITVNKNSCTVTYYAQIVCLLPKEYKLLVLFLEYPNHVLTYEMIVDQLWDLDRVPSANGIRSHIKGLRKAFRKVNNTIEIIETVHGMGYRLNPVLLKQEDSETLCSLPPPPILKDFLQTKAIEYCILDQQFFLQYISPSLIEYCDYPESLKIGSYVGDSFPELIGFEEILAKVITKEEPNLEIQGVARSVNPKRPAYVNFYVMANQDVHWPSNHHEPLLFIFIEDASEKMSYKQRITQLENEMSLFGTLNISYLV
ncbi:winged helix-turn-helix domain-containing protein [Planktothrix mougeotii]|uniref:winged helix-turn-helix domain-containing protein n=1 Tax=Planktothrix mougeotii TaxID=54306 RepID=UPI00188168B2|nr:response regulator transcription factor [Planktothrix mougeotii]